MLYKRVFRMGSEKKKMRAKKCKKMYQRTIAFMLASTSIFGVNMGLHNDSSKSSLNAKMTAW